MNALRRDKVSRKKDGFKRACRAEAARLNKLRRLKLKSLKDEKR